MTAFRWLCFFPPKNPSKIMELFNCFGPLLLLVAWPEPTTPTPTTTTTPGPTTTLPPGQWIANNIVYTKLEHPCVEYYASCPLICPKGTQTLPNGTMCETCDCGGSITGRSRIFLFCFNVLFFFNQSLITGNSYYRVVKCFGIRSMILCFVAFSGSLFDPIIIVTGISYT